MKTQFLFKIIPSVAMSLLVASSTSFAGDITAKVLQETPNSAVTQNQNKSDLKSFLVQGSNITAVKQAVISVGGIITHELKIIKSVAANLTDDQADKIRKFKHIKRVKLDRKAEVAGPVMDAVYPTLVGANELHDTGIDGRDIRNSRSLG